MSYKIPKLASTALVRLLQDLPYGEQNLLKGTEITVPAGQARAWIDRKMCEAVAPSEKTAKVKS